MNWNEIKEKYPKAYQKQQEFFSALRVPIAWRHLYDFFDEQGVSVTIDWSHSEVEPSKPDWNYTINDFGFPALLEEWDSGYKTRTEAEEQAFTKAFEILEEKLK